jgi:hypothetical protein
MRLLFATMAGVLLCAPLSARGQAIVNEPNSLGTSMTYTFAPSGRLLLQDDIEIPNILIFSHSLVLDAEYATPVEGLAVDASFTTVGVKLGDGSFNHFPEAGEYDDNEFHVTPTDFRGGLRYQLKFMQEALFAAVFVAGSVPVRDYPTYGLTAPGRGLKEAHVGLAVARTLDPVLPRLFLAARYQYAFVERVKSEDPATREYKRNYSDVSGSLGYYITDRLSAALSANARMGHGGLQLLDYTLVSETVQRHHDQLLDEDVVLAGGDLGFAVTDALSLGLSARFFVSGRNTRNQNLYALTASYQMF